MTTDMFQLSLALPCPLLIHRVRNMTGATSSAETACPSGPHEFALVFTCISRGHVAHDVNYMFLVL